MCVLRKSRNVHIVVKIYLSHMGDYLGKMERSHIWPDFFSKSRLAA